jgi:hypothetical protein
MSTCGQAAWQACTDKVVTHLLICHTIARKQPLRRLYGGHAVNAPSVKMQAAAATSNHCCN